MESVFSAAVAFPRQGSTKLRRVLSFGGGRGPTGGAKILLREAVASLLNASHPGVDFPRTERRLISAVNNALASGDRETMIDLASLLEDDNNLRCPLN